MSCATPTSRDVLSGISNAARLQDEICDPSSYRRNILRLSSELQSLRERAPYLNYDTLPHAHPEPPSQTTRWKFLKSGYGSRHISDVAEFSLWDEYSQKFRQPTSNEATWITKYYQAEEVLFTFPTIKIKTSVPPEPLPLTVACVAVQFLPSTAKATPPPSVTAYANPRLPDPMSFNLPAWGSPSEFQRREIIDVLSAFVNIQSITWLGPRCFVEIRRDEKRYDNHSLPGYVAGKPTLYHYAEGGLWGGMTSRAKSRVIDPGKSATPCQDTTNYLQEGVGQLQPGVRVSNSLDSRGPSFADTEYSTTCGVRLKRDREILVTGANHGMVDCDDVYHPSTIGGTKIGEIVYRFPEIDVAMFRLIPAVQFANDDYFQANPPTRLLKSQDFSDGAWCSADGMSTGLVFFQCVGTKTTNMDTRTMDFITERVFSVFGPVGQNPVEGICGAPMVEESCELQGIPGGGVYSFFRYGDEDLAILPVLDNLINEGWENY